MLYMRHTVYVSALTAEQDLGYKYTHLLYLREDNIFAHQTRYNLSGLAEAMDKRIEVLPKGAHTPAVLVDRHCGWGSYSDKMYFANRQAAEVLFTSTRHEHVQRMAAWVAHAHVAKRRGDPLQTEEWLTFLLNKAGADIQKLDFNRTELRYIKHRKTGQIASCIAESHYKCTTAPGYPQCDRPAVWCWPNCVNTTTSTPRPMRP